MSSTLKRLDALLAEAPALEPWIGGFDRSGLLEWLELELGDAHVLDDWIAFGPIRSRAVPFSPLLHVVSGNTPHAAFQSLFRGLVLGAHNRVKLPSAGLVPFERWLENLPPVLARLVEWRRDLPEAWLVCEAAVVFGDSSTLATFRNLLFPETRFIEHGPKLGVAMIFEPEPDLADRIAGDILRHDQRGCLSVQAIYLNGKEDEIHRFGEALALALAAYRGSHPRAGHSLSDSGAVSNAREIVRFRQANQERVMLWESTGSTDWTIVHEPDAPLAAGPLNGHVTLHPMPSSLDIQSLGTEARFISTIAVYPYTAQSIARLDKLSSPRICEVGRVHETTVFWHHDSYAPLSSLVRWRDLG